jgi:hypothetical protein
VTPLPNGDGWNRTAVNVVLEATDLASGLSDTPAGWVDQLQYSLAGAQTGAEMVVPGHSASFVVGAEGITTVRYFATDAAGNEETARTLGVKIDRTAPVLTGPALGECTLWPPNHERIAVLRASDALSGLASLDVSTTSNETLDPSDVAVVDTGDGGRVVEVRAERSGGSKSGRVYDLTFTAKDNADNAVTKTVTCTVPHDMGKN